MEEITKLSFTKTYWSMIFGLSLGAIAHLWFLYLFYSYEVTPLFYLNIFSVAVFLSMLYLVITRKLILLAMIVASIELILHQVLAVAFLGWEYGFQYYVLAVPSFVLLGHFSNKIIPITFTIIAILTLILLKIYSFYIPPIYSMEEIKEFLSLANIVFMALPLTVFTGVFAFNSHRNEKRLLAAQEELYTAATIDPLTGLINRSKTMEEMESLRQNSLGTQENYVLAIVDIDNFKEVNDQYGHDMGDIVLINIADSMEQLLRPSDIVGRWGGEEFIILMPKTSLAQGIHLLENMIARIERTPIEFDEIKVAVTVTIGAVESSSETNEKLLKQADAALYKGKESSKNCVVPCWSS